MIVYLALSFRAAALAVSLDQAGRDTVLGTADDATTLSRFALDDGSSNGSYERHRGSCSRNPTTRKWEGTAFFRVLPWAMGVDKTGQRSKQSSFLVELSCDEDLYQSLNALVKGSKVSRVLGQRPDEKLIERLKEIHDDYKISSRNQSAKASLSRGLAKYVFEMKTPTWGLLARYKGKTSSEFPRDHCRAAEWTDEDMRCVHCCVYSNPKLERIF